MKSKSKTQKTQKTQKIFKKQKKRLSKKIFSKNWRLVVPKITKLGLYPWDPKMVTALKSHVLKLLLEKESSRGLKNYMISVEKHLSGFAHLDILMLYSKRIGNTMTRYDYIVKHGDLTRYSTVNKSILDYGRKDDPNPLANFNTGKILLNNAASSKKSLHSILLDAMKKDPCKFNAWQWIHKNNLSNQMIMTSYSSVINAIEKEQKVICQNILRSKPGIQQITPVLIRKTLTPTQYMQYKSWAGYDVIISHINQIVKWGWNRPHKTKNLYLIGVPDIGKTTLLRHLAKFCSTYNLGIKGGWFPYYQSETYQLLAWNEFNLKNYAYPDLLQLLEGEMMTLPVKGGHVLRTDNQLIIATSNLTIEEHVKNKFWRSSDREHSVKNLKARFTEVQIPHNKTLFLLLPLIKQKNN